MLNPPLPHYIEVDDTGPCIWCGVPTRSAETNVAGTWLCKGVCWDFLVRAREDEARRQLEAQGAVTTS